jgi:hypothetical protein
MVCGSMNENRLWNRHFIKVSQRDSPCSPIYDATAHLSAIGAENRILNIDPAEHSKMLANQME